MKNLVLILLLIFALTACNSSYDSASKTENEKAVSIEDGDTVRIADEESEYEIIIIEPGFNNWLLGRARPPGYYSQQFLENRNMLYVNAWNNRVLEPQTFDPRLYFQQIDYNPNIDYGYEVNYKLYYYFIYFQLTYDQRLTNLVPRI